MSASQAIVNYLQQLLGADWTVESDNDPPYIQLVARKGSTVAFHIVIVWGEGTVEDAVVVCGQEVMTQTLGNDAHVSFSVYHSTTQTVYLYTIDPATGDAKRMEHGTGNVRTKAAMLKSCAEANYATLSVPDNSWIWSEQHQNYYRRITVGGQQQIEWAQHEQQ